jgi:hypothetical protein
VSDNYLRIIPTDPNLIPPETVADQMVPLLGPAFPDADDVVAESHGHPVFVDQGSNLEAILCPACGTRLLFYPAADAEAVWDWWYELTDALGEGDAAQAETTMPCCQAVVPFSDLQFDWPAGVASFEISIMTPGASDPPSSELQQRLEALLGCQVKYVWAHY